MEAMRGLVRTSRPDNSARYRLAEVGRQMPPSRNGKPVGPGTVKRWIVVGVLSRKNPDGARIYLEAERFPSGWAVTNEAIRRFIDALTRDRLPGGATLRR